MNYLTQLRLSFPAGHTLHTDDSPCGNAPHGHSYELRVTYERTGLGDQDLAMSAHNRTAVQDLVRELANRDLNKMLGPHEPTVYGIAAFFMDRLQITIPITRVEVHEDSAGPIAILDRTSDI